MWLEATEMGTEGIEPPSFGLEPSILPLNDVPKFNGHHRKLIEFTTQRTLSAELNDVPIKHNQKSLRLQTLALHIPNKIKKNDLNFRLLIFGITTKIYILLAPFLEMSKKKVKEEHHAHHAEKNPKHNAAEKHQHHHSEKHEERHQEHTRKRYDLEDTLIRNLIELQKINIDLAEKFDKLSKEISQLLGLFETTARTFAKVAPLGEYEKDKEFLEKIDKLLDQNKTLAKGLSLMEERLRERVYGGAIRPVEAQKFEGNQVVSSIKRPLPKF